MFHEVSHAPFDKLVHGPGSKGVRRKSQRTRSVAWLLGWADLADLWFAVVLGMLVLVRHQRNLRDAWAAFRSAS